MRSTSHIVRGTAFVALVFLSACTGMTDTQQRVVSGAAVGAVVGTVGTAMTGGCIPCGTAIGGAVGAGAGYLIDQVDGNKKQSTPAPSSATSSVSSN